LIRELRERDIPEILKIERMSFSSPWSELAFSQEICKPHAFSKVALLQEKIIGYLCVNLIFDEGHILNLAVHPDFRRQGIATKLLKEILNAAGGKGCEVFYLEVRGSNAEARMFYERLGFRIAGVRKNYYVSPVEDASLMVLRV
jgi:[ribosomal protein S18]-alanine N-acetyltransferase